LGHSYLGEWINIGALCTNSDIKNDYSTVQVYVKGEFKDSEATKVGSFIGDHTKLGIGCLLNTGTVIGLGSNIVTAGRVIFIDFDNRSRNRSLIVQIMGE